MLAPGDRPALTPAAARRWDLATAALLAAAAALVAATFRQYGSTWDEPAQAELGHDVLRWFSTLGRDVTALSGGSPGNLHLYGGLFEAVVELVVKALPWSPYEGRHLVNATAALAGAGGVALLARRLGGPRAGFAAAALLLTTPPWWGHGFANSKDVPFAAAYAWLLLALLRLCDELPRPRPRLVVAAGVALGVTLGVRPGGLVLLLPLAAGVVAVRLLPRLAAPGAESRGRVVAAAAGRLLAVGALGWAGMLACWPYGLLHPLSAPAGAVSMASRFEWDALVRYAGRWVQSTDLPRGYVPVWFLSTLPETWFVVAVAGAAGAALVARRKPLPAALTPAWLDPALVAVAGLGPIVAAVATRPVLYDGVRHLLFCVPALAALAGWAFSAALAALPRLAAGAAAGAAGAAAVLAVSDAVLLHPYQYVYFNRLVAGGLPGASGRFELDYWGASGREAAEWISRNVPGAARGPLHVASTSDPRIIAYWLEPGAESRFSFDAEGPVADLRIALTRLNEHRATGKVLHVVERMGVPLLYVIAPQAAAAPLVFEGGDAAVALSPAGGWVGLPRVAAGVERAAYALRRIRGLPAAAELQLMTPATGGAPTLEALHAEVATLAAQLLGVPAASLAPEPVEGPFARGWIVGAGRTPFTIVAAARLETSAVVIVARYGGDPDGAAREIRAWIEGIRPADPAERHLP